MNTQTQPALTVGGLTLASLTAAVAAVLVLLRVFDIYNVTEDQYAAILGFVAALWAIVTPMVFAIRGIAYAPATVQEIKETLVAEDPNTPLSPEAAAAMAK